VPGFTHNDWQQALQALPDDETRAWYQVRMGHGATGYTTADGVIIFNQGSGENGKTAVTTDGLVPALGDYASTVSTKLITSSEEHSTERAALRGQRLLIGEELTEDRELNITAIKQIADVGEITARFVHRDNFTFKTSHSIAVNTNYRARVRETDHGTWRRLKMVAFPFTFKKSHEQLEGPNDRRGDSGLKARIRANATGQHNAIVTWVVEGARRFFELGDFPAPPAAVESATRAWRREADRVQDFFDTRLMPDKSRCVWTIELMSAFNQHLEANGHRPWSKETFHPQFQAHSETARHGVVLSRPKTKPAFSQFSWSTPAAMDGERFNELPVRPEVYVGVRFRTDADDEEGAKQAPKLDGR
jgi:P4 family phage/plasmid primase-like protien